ACLRESPNGSGSTLSRRNRRCTMFSIPALGRLHPNRTRRRHRPKISRRPLAMERLEDRLVLSTTWIEQGPGPILGAFNAVIPNQNNPEDGAVAGLATDPTKANIIYTPTVHRGVWETTHRATPTPTGAPPPRT